ncbi:MAG: hypothetical protein F6K34_15290, partial [Okeania sp. SIO4D6]|nr:hypothetical protein [Okeania sp. SIO4D6]
KFPELLSEALAEARQIQDEYARFPVLEALADKLTPDLLPEALAAAQDNHKKDRPGFLTTGNELTWNEDRAEFLAALAEKLTPEILPEALAVAGQIKEEKYRVQVLSAWANQLSQMPKTQLYSLWQNILHTLSFGSRPELLSNIKALTPVIFSLGGEEAIKNTAIAIQDVSRWWR